MTPTETITILRRYNVWRRGNLEGMPQPDPREIGEAIDAAIEMIKRLEAAEKERDALRAKIERMEKQEPVAWCATDETGTGIEALGMNQSRRFATALYLAPGAQGEEK